ncbi:serine proteinase stubble isoform X1 [Nasonia vitripennis]|uniref:Peptidase S1 domain-containing protein n=1 Tax=Nasonia vitripennis TaxID=7425 RepID=A0A7M7HC71_NASVI|nr:serine proteinase stubble isoform X1 [Nasonia vitripennis]
MLITKPCSCLLLALVLGLRSSTCRAAASSSSSSTSLVSLPTSSSSSSSPTSPLQRFATSSNTTASGRSRRRRFVRFPALPPSYVLEGAGPPPPIQQSRSLGFASVRFGGPSAGQYPTWRQHKSYWRQHSGPPTIGADYPARPSAPVMGHRTPRLIFRDNDFPVVSGSANNFFQSNQLPDVEEDFRDHRKQIFNEYPRLETECGISASKQTAQRRIVGGDEAGFGSFPWQAYIRIGSSRCGGTLVNRFHVVTAGHCVAKASARQVQVTLGDYVVNSATESLPAYTFGVREIRVHPYFKFTPQADRFDVAVLRLDRPVHYMPHIAPICLPEKNEDFLGQYGWAAGWGALQAGSRLRPKTLQAVDVPVIDNRVCERWHRTNGINVVIYDEMMCAGYRGGGKDSCQGDSGGPLMLEKTGKWYLIGIVSAGYSCAQPGQPGIYHRVAKTVDWITYVINS